MRLIDADALVRIVQQSTQDAGLHFSDSQKFLRWLRKAHTIDVAPVVRCVDCKYRCTLVCPMYHTEYCDDGDGFYDDYDVDNTYDDGFCNLGERWEGEEE